MAANLVEGGADGKVVPASSSGERCGSVLVEGLADPPGLSRRRRLRGSSHRLDGTRGVTQCGATKRLSTISIGR
jgi:hypothetical protein